MFGVGCSIFDRLQIPNSPKASLTTDSYSVLQIGGSEENTANAYYISRKLALLQDG